MASLYGLESLGFRYSPLLNGHGSLCGTFFSGFHSSLRLWGLGPGVEGVSGSGFMCRELNPKPLNP